MNKKDLTWQKDFMKKSDIVNQYVRANRRFENMFYSRIRKAIHVKVSHVINDLSKGYDYAINNLSIDIGNNDLEKEVKSLYETVGVYHARATDRRLKKDIRKGFGFNAEWTKFINDYLAEFLFDKITFAVADTTKNALLKALTAGNISGLSIDGMIEQLTEWPFERYQAARIVRTEVNRASNVGALAQSKTSEYEQQKEWISVEDNRTRGQHPGDHANHVALNGVKIDAGDDFIDPVNGDRLHIPGDTMASAASTIECRCQAVFINKRDANGNLIPKRKTTTVIYPGQIRTGQTITI